ncbi:hypothetical protein NEPAR04_2223 [Nematocida parisii]|nr:hypothetical protein NEPAR04_2223 [Nematocida parisii]KAI5168173.1 hypothetical protein NEIRO02_2445 [Nematocida sp. AWRm79]
MQYLERTMTQCEAGAGRGGIRLALTHTQKPETGNREQCCETCRVSGQCKRAVLILAQIFTYPNTNTCAWTWTGGTDTPDTGKQAEPGTENGKRAHRTLGTGAEWY